MKRAHIAITVALLFGFAATLAAAAFDRRNGERFLEAEAGFKLKESARRLESELESVLRDSGAMTTRLAVSQDTDEKSLREGAEGILAGRPWVVSVVLSRDLSVFFVHPLKGNESILGVNFHYRPEFIDGIRHAVSLRKGIVTGPTKLLQSGRLGLIVRDPIFVEEPGGGAGSFWGMASIAIDMENLFQHAGLASPDAPYDVAIRSETTDGGQGGVFFGNARLFREHAIAADVELPDRRWRIVGALKPETLKNLKQNQRIYEIGGLLTLTLALAAFVWGRSADRSGAVSIPLLRNGDFSLRAILSASMLLLLPAIALVSWLSHRAAADVTDQFTERLTEQISERIWEKVAAFFDIPLHIVALNADQARMGLLNPYDGEAVAQLFLLQLRRQPFLTFVSMGTPHGEYYSASRPPLGADKNLRLIHARISDGREMRIYGVDDANRRSSLLAIGNSHFDATTRPWFKAAVASGAIGWYAPYRYALFDGTGAYSSLGMGVSAPLMREDGAFLGVVTADVALSQLSGLLAAAVSDSGGVAFLAEENGDLLAASIDLPVYSLDGDKVVRVSAQSSANATIKEAGMAIAASKQAEGKTVVGAGDARVIFQWRRLQLPSGPALTIGLALPENRYMAPLRRIMDNVAMLGAAIMLVSIVVALFATDWVSRPLVLLNQWATRLAAGDWSAEPPVSSPISEVRSLSLALGRMASRLKSYTDELERRVQERTEALEAANRQLAELSATDSLTGLANRRRFDDALRTEWARARRTNQPLTLMMIDVDHFKKFNDRYGHLAGDDCLRQVADALRHCVRRAGDLSARYGGEEFGVIVADTHLGDARMLAERIRRQVQELAIPHADSPCGNITVSIGVAESVPSDAHSEETLLRAADTALYCAKESGRNKVEGGTLAII